MRITLWIVSQQSIPFFTTYKMIRLFSLYFSHSLLRDDDRPPLNLSEKALLPWGILMERCIDRLRSFHFLLKLLSSISMKKSLHLSTFSFTFYLSASSRSIQPRHINIISTSFYFIFPTIHRALFPTPSSIIFIKLSQVQTHYITRRFFISYSSFHSIFFLNFITQSGSHFFIQRSQ